MKHVLARIFLGSVMARCVVDFAPLKDGRTELVIQGGLASDGDIEGSAGYTAALAVYQGATSRWLEQAKYAVPIGANNAVYLLRQQADQWLVVVLFGSAQYGVYSIGATGRSGLSSSGAATTRPP